MAKKKTVSEYPRTRIVWFTSNVFGADGKVIITLNQVKDAIQKHSTSLKRYAVEMHDKDVHDEESIKDREARRSRLYIETYKGYAKQMGLAEDHGTPDAPNPSGYAYDAQCVAKTKAYQDWLCPERKVGDPKEIHIHCALELKNARCLDEIARWFGLPVNLFDKVTGRHAFEDCAEYLVHAKQPEKYQYDPKTVWANFDYPEWLENQKILDIQHGKYRIGKDEIYDMVNDVYRGKMTLQDVKEKLTFPVYANNWNLFQKARNEYLYENAPMPAPRQTFYVDTRGGIAMGSSRGKTVCSKALCKLLAKGLMEEKGLSKKVIEENMKKPIDMLQDYIYVLGKKNVTWQKYDGQPILMVDDKDGNEMLKACGDNSGVKTLLEEFPTKFSENRKYGDTVCVAKYIVINGIVPFSTFCAQLAGVKEEVNGNNGDRYVTYKDPVTQYYRRMAWVIVLTEDQIAMYFNDGMLNDTEEFQQYKIIKQISGNMRRLVNTVDVGVQNEIEEKTFAPLIEKSKAYDKKKSEDSKAHSINDAPDDVKHFGEEVSGNLPELWTVEPTLPDGKGGYKKVGNNTPKIHYPENWRYNYSLYNSDQLSYDDFKKWALMSGMTESDFDSEVIYHEPAKAY